METLDLIANLLQARRPFAELSHCVSDERDEHADVVLASIIVDL